MHKNILLVIDRDQFKSFDFKLSSKVAKDQLAGNSGNSIFQYSIQKILVAERYNKITIDTKLLHKSPLPSSYFDIINNEFDCAVILPANILAEFSIKENFALHNNRLKKLKIPIYAIGLGCQSNVEYSFNFLNYIMKDAKIYIKNILKNNGFIGLRGEFSAECISRLGFKEDSDYNIIGCPSLFMHGDTLNIKKKNYSEDDFIPALNGFRIWNLPEYHKYFVKYPLSIFVDQDEFYNLLYCIDDLSWKEFKYLCDNEKNWIRLYKENRIKLFCDYISWSTYLKKRKVNFSCGCRVHGNIVSILNGIPAYIDSFDSRTRELCEWFNIPHHNFNSEVIDPYCVYIKSDYTVFNSSFKNKFYIFDTFMKKCNILTNYENIMNEYCDEYYIEEKYNIKKLEYISNICRKNKILVKMLLKIIKLYYLSRMSSVYIEIMEV
ncbi:MAG: polysaccharide pyruvyl transferase family protein [Desulfovibrio sp.]|jgi:hypothetical protein|nr:polysaccharide pyruvyl transferase family protein [Desulfovibrio sp.]